MRLVYSLTPCLLLTLAGDDMEAKMATLVGLGFTREQATGALNATGGNVDMAASMLFS